MTSRDVLMAVLRRWYLMALGGLLSMAVLYAGLHEKPVYFTRFYVVLLPPRDATVPNNLEDPHYWMTPLAGVIVTEYNAGVRQPILGSGDTTLYGEGMREGSRVRLPNHGSQWKPIYDVPNIEVQVVGPDPEDVAARAKSIGARLELLLATRQDELRVTRTMRVSAFMSPAEPAVAQVGGSRSRTAASMAILGATLTTIAVVRLDQWWIRRRGRRAVPALHE